MDLRFFASKQSIKLPLFELCMSHWSIPGGRSTRNSTQFQNLSFNMAASGGSGVTASTVITETFIIDPFAGNISPGTTCGQKLFTEACSALDEADKLTASVENQHMVMEHILSIVQKFRWGPQVLAVNLSSNLTTAKSIITESHALSLVDLKVQAYKIWGGGPDNATTLPVNVVTNRRNLILTDLNVTAASMNQEKRAFYARVRSTIIC